MEKLPMCRICLVEDVRMCVVVNKNLHELYEKLTDVPFVTEDSRPMLACFFCCTKLKQCWRFLTKCLEAEKIFTQMLNEDYETDPLINRGHLEFFNGFSYSAIELFSIIDDGRTASNAINEELPDVSESPDDIFDPEEEHQTGITEIKLENVDTSYPDLPVYHAESDSEYEVPLMEIKTEVEDYQESIGAPVAKKPNLDTRRPKPRDAISAKQKKNDNSQQLSCVAKIVTKTQNNASKRTTTFKGPFTKTQNGVNNSMNNTALGTSSHNYINKEKNIDSDDIKRYRKVCVKEKLFKCDICQRSFSKNCDLTRHTRTHTGEKPFKCDICQQRFSQNSSLVCHTRVHTGEKPFQCDIC